jgi:uncharacterized protein
MKNLLYRFRRQSAKYILTVLCFLSVCNASGQRFKVIGFYTGRQDPAHISFVREANSWFYDQGKMHGFQYDSTNDWSNLNEAFLSVYDVVIFLDTRPDSAAPRLAFENYMKQGGKWMGFHFAGFALTPSAYPQNWNWYHQEFLGVGQYRGNTWKPTSALLRVESKKHPATKKLPMVFKSAPNEWYSWEYDLRTNKDIEILLAIDSSSFPLGTGPKPHEIWHNGYYPVVWTNKNYQMIYFNMGHNDMDYDHKPNRQLSSTFSQPSQNRLIIDALLWLGDSKKKKSKRK